MAPEGLAAKAYFLVLCVFGLLSQFSAQADSHALVSARRVNGALLYEHVPPAGSSVFVTNEDTFQTAIYNESSGVIALGSSIDLTTTIIVTAGNFTFEGNGFTVNGKGLTRCFFIQGAGVFVTMRDMIITRGAVSKNEFGGAIWLDNFATLSLINTAISDCTAGTGGGIYLGYQCHCTIVGSLIYGNRALSTTGNLQSGEGCGGGIFARQAAVSIDRTTFENNEASLSGGGIFVSWSPLGFSTVISDSVIKNNLATYGGGLNADSTGSTTKKISVVSLSTTFILDNAAREDGGGLYAGSGSSLTMHACEVARNQAGVTAGGLLVCGSTLTMAAVNITDNTAGSGGGGGTFLRNGARGLANICHVLRNTADKGGGVGIIGGAELIMRDSSVDSNVAKQLNFQVINGPCIVSGDCMFSPNFPLPYGKYDQCNFKVRADDKLVVQRFNLNPTGDMFVGNSSWYTDVTGPNNKAVQRGEHIMFTPDTMAGFAGSGFQICSSSTANGGGFYVSGGGVLVLFSTNVTSNRATQGAGVFLATGAVLSMESQTIISANEASGAGGGMYIDASFASTSKSSIVDNRVGPVMSEGSAVYLFTGRFEGADMTIKGNFSGLFADASTVCSSSCPAGTYGTCQTVPGASLCQANCGVCNACPAGTSSDKVGATCSTSCTPCGPGQASGPGSAECASCVPGYFAATDADDTDGGVAFQVLRGATQCNMCPSGKFASTPATIVCMTCPTTQSSLNGATSCTLAAHDFYMDPETGESTKCPQHATCQGGDELPRPEVDYYVPNNIQYAGHVYRCPRGTCTGAAPPPQAVAGTEPSSPSLGVTTQQSEGDSVDDSSEQPSCFSASSSKRCNNDAFSSVVCSNGASGPLCSSCDDGFVYSSADISHRGGCITCQTSKTIVWAAFSLAVCVFILGIVIYRNAIPFPACIATSSIVGVFNMVDTGTFRVTWSTYQIVESVSWNLNTELPALFSKMENTLTVISFDFISLECFNISHLNNILLWSIIPLCIMVANAAVFAVRYAAWARFDPEALRVSVRQHVFFGLMLSYLVLPPVSRVQFEAFQCVTVAGESYLRSDTRVRCASRAYAAFAAANWLFVVLYMSVPFVWLALLLRKRRRMNPWLSNRNVSLRLRDADESLQPLKFLFSCYSIDYFYFEVVEMARRIFFVGVLPLVSQDGGKRCVAGILGALISLAMYENVEPFVRPLTNVLVHVAQYAILLNYGAVLVISTGLYRSALHEAAFGALLVAVNFVVIGFALGMAVYGHMEKVRWQARALTDDELAIVRAVMGPHEDGAGGGEAGPGSGGLAQSSGAAGDGGGPSSATALKQLLLSPGDVKLERKVGAGAFGEVYQASYRGQAVAVKTLHTITEDTVNAFRGEILLHGALRHVNVVAFVGACWGRELTALVLEWVPRGSLADLLEGSDQGRSSSPSGQASGSDLTWADPLLKLATDVARGMAYLHAREYYEEATGKRHRCVLHRDLKPSNVLISDFSVAKLADFGASRARHEVGDGDAEGLLTTVVGTPVFSAPEVLMGHPYDESADVYSFGCVLVDMACGDGLVALLRHRFARDFPGLGAATVRKVMGAVWRDGWRPVARDEEGALPGAPPAVRSLVLRCCAHDPRERPCFSGVLAELSGAALSQVEGASFTRGRIEAPTATAAAKAANAAAAGAPPPAGPPARPVLAVGRATSSSGRGAGAVGSLGRLSLKESLGVEGAVVDFSLEGSFREKGAAGVSRDSSTTGLLKPLLARMP